MEEGTSFMAVQHKLSSSKPSIFPMFFGKLSTFKHPKRSRELSNFKLQMVLGRHTRFLQYLRINKVRVVKPSIDEGSTFIAVPLKSSFLRPLRFPMFSGKLSKFEHPKRFRVSSDFKLQMVLGRQISFLQPIRSRRTSFLRNPMDG